MMRARDAFSFCCEYPVLLRLLVLAEDNRLLSLFVLIGKGSSSGKGCLSWPVWGCFLHLHCTVNFRVILYICSSKKKNGKILVSSKTNLLNWMKCRQVLPDTVGSEDGETGSQVKKWKDHLEAGKVRKWTLIQKEHRLVTLNMNQERSISFFSFLETVMSHYVSLAGLELWDPLASWVLKLKMCATMSNLRSISSPFEDGVFLTEPRST